MHVRPTYLYVTAGISPKRLHKRPLAVIKGKRWNRKLGGLHVRRVHFAESNGASSEPGLPELVEHSEVSALTSNGEPLLFFTQSGAQDTRTVRYMLRML